MHSLEEPVDFIAKVRCPVDGIEVIIELNNIDRKSTLTNPKNFS